MTESSWISLAIVLACGVWLSWRGFQYGVIRTLQRLLALLCAYLAGYFFMLPVAKWVQLQTGWQFIPASFVSGMVCFIAVVISAEKLMGMVIARMGKRGIKPARIPGAVLGASLGSLLGLILVWLGGIMFDAFRLQEKDKFAPPDPVRTMAGNMVGSAVERAMEQQMDEGSLVPAMASQLVSNPLNLTRQVMQISQSDAMRALFSDPDAQRLMLTQQSMALQANPHFEQLVALPQAAEILALLGEKGADGQSLDQKEKTARLLASLYQKIYRIQHDPRFLTLTEKPEFRQLSQNPSPLAVLTNPVLSELGGIIFSESPVEVLPVSPDPDNTALQRLEPLQGEMLDPASTEAPAQEGRVMYHWTDEAGVKHYDENMPEGDYVVEVIQLDGS